MPSSTPFFSIIVATHLRSTLLERALQSLRAQTFADFEVVVVADALDAGTAAVAAQWLRERDLFVKRSGAPGPADSRNLALRLASGEWLMFLDDDDTFAPHHLETAHRRITQPASDAERAARLLFSDFEVVTENREQALPAPLSRTPVPLQANDVAGLHVKNFIPNSCLIYPVATVRTKRFDEALGLNEDWDFLLNVLRDSTLAYVPIHGPVIHQSPSEQADRRGVQNEGLILDVMPRIYRKWPAPTDALRASRQALFATSGIMLSLDDL